jgi:hypothetical protein
MNKFLHVAAVCGIASALLLGGCSEKKEASPVPETSQAAEANLQITKWGPQSTKVGQGFNVQPSGESALWFEAPAIGGLHTYEVWFGDTKLENVSIVQNKGGSALVPSKLLAQAGKYPVYIIAKPAGTKYEVGTLEILP